MKSFPRYVAAYASHLVLNLLSFLVTFLLAIILVKALMFAVNIIGELPVLGLANHRVEIGGAVRITALADIRCGFGLPVADVELRDVAEQQADAHAGLVLPQGGQQGVPVLGKAGLRAHVCVVPVAEEDDDRRAVLEHAVVCQRAVGAELIGDV